MFLPRIILSSCLIFVTAFSMQAQKTGAKEWSIADYFKNLPERYKTFEGDFHPASEETKIIDEQNGYAAYLNLPPQPEADNQRFPVFQMALFKSRTKPPLLVVSNYQSDHVCEKYETFFLRRVGNDWTEVKREVLPPLDLKMFWDEPQSAQRLLKIVGRQSAASYHFDLPRRGTQVETSLEICDYLEDNAPDADGEELEKIIRSAKTIRLEWDKQNGKFKLAK